MEPRRYIFTSERLGFREWTGEDIPLMAAINADPAVMEFFPRVKTFEETEQFVARMKREMAERKYCYFAVDVLADGRFIGFIGMSYQSFAADFTPCTDIGWRLDKAAWGNGYATEGARRCLKYAFEEPGMESIVAIMPVVNARSERVARRIGMKKIKVFTHPLLADDERLRECALYEWLPVR